MTDLNILYNHIDFLYYYILIPLEMDIYYNKYYHNYIDNLLYLYNLKYIDY